MSGLLGFFYFFVFIFLILGGGFCLLVFFVAVLVWFGFWRKVIRFIDSFLIEVLGTELRTSCVLSTHSTTEIFPPL